MILQISKLPPPIGGVTIHVKRLVQRLQGEKEFDVDVLDYSRVKNPLTIIRKIVCARLIHIHLSNKKFRFCLVLILRLLFKKVIVTFHGKYDFENYYDRTVLKTSCYSVVLNKFTYENATKFNSKVKLIGAFIPPIEKDIFNLNNETLRNIENLRKNNYEFVFCTNASSYVLDSKEKEIYMGTELVEFFGSNLNYALIFSDPSGSYTEYFENENMKLPSNIYIINTPHDFINVIKLSDILIRATTMDGDSLSIKEALYYHKPVLATDVVDRYNSVILFNNFSDLKEKIKSIKGLTNVAEVEDSSIEIIKLYHELLDKN